MFVFCMKYFMQFWLFLNTFYSSLTQDLVDKHKKEMSKRNVRIDPRALHWTPKDWSKRAKW